MLRCKSNSEYINICRYIFDDMMLYGDTFMYVIFPCVFFTLPLPLRKEKKKKHNVENQILNLYPKHQRKATEQKKIIII